MPSYQARSRENGSQKTTVICLPSQRNLKRLEKQPILGVKRTKTKLSWGTREGQQAIRSDSVGYQSRWLRSPTGQPYVLRVVDRYLVQFIPSDRKTIYIAQFVHNRAILLMDVPKNHYLYLSIEKFLGIDLDDCERSIVQCYRRGMIRSCSTGQHNLNRQRHKRSKSRNRPGKRERLAREQSIDLIPYSDSVALKKHELKRKLNH